MAKTNRRHGRLIRVDLQLKIVFLTLLVVSLLLLINYQLSTAAMWSISAKLSDKTDLAEVRRVLFQMFLLSVAMGIPFAAAVGILYSFGFCGPLHRFKMFIVGLTEGTWKKPCALRSGDDLQDLCQVINDARVVACDYADEAHEALQEARAVLDEVTASDDALAVRISDLKEKIVRENKAFQKHFAHPLPAEDRPPEAESPAASANQKGAEVVAVS